MKTTNYSEIAKRYENNKFRVNVKEDSDLEEFLRTHQDSREIRILDLACGSGIYLHEQTGIFDMPNFIWYGLDSSPDMLKLAREKCDNVEFIEGVAEKLPYQDNYFDFVVCNYAFHHFEQKDLVLREVKRVLRKGGVFKILDLSIQDMRKWWVYKCFSNTYKEDLKRFWDKELLFNELMKEQFRVELRMTYKMKNLPVSKLLEYAQNRDISTLTIISDEDYNLGIEKMENMKSGTEGMLINEYAEAFFIAHKR